MHLRLFLCHLSHSRSVTLWLHCEYPVSLLWILTGWRIGTDMGVFVLMPLGRNSNGFMWGQQTRLMKTLQMPEANSRWKYISNRKKANEKKTERLENRGTLDQRWKKKRKREKKRRKILLNTSKRQKLEIQNDAKNESETVNRSKRRPQKKTEQKHSKCIGYDSTKARWREFNLVGLKKQYQVLLEELIGGWTGESEGPQRNRVTQPKSVSFRSFFFPTASRRIILLFRGMELVSTAYTKKTTRTRKPTTVNQFQSNHSLIPINSNRTGSYKPHSSSRHQTFGKTKKKKKCYW